jgi:carboxymethylenebutenolidase
MDMDLAAGWTTYEWEAGPVPAYRARPAAAPDPLPAVIVIQEAWGVDDHIIDVAARLATAGYLTLAPDLYAAGGERPEPLRAERMEALKRFMNTMPPSAWTDTRSRQEALDLLPEPERGEVAESMAAMSAALTSGDHLHVLRAAVGHLRADPHAAGKPVGCVGFCLGGSLSGRLACSEPNLGAAAIFYGMPPSEEDLQGLSCPLLGFYGGDDHRISDAVPTMAKTIEEIGGSFEYHIYPRAPHAFFNDTRPSYRVDAARDAWARLLGFFAEHLGRS